MSLPMRGGMLRYHSRADLRNRLPECVAGHSSNTLKTYRSRSEEHTSELQSRLHLVCRLLLEKKKIFRFDRKGTRLNSSHGSISHAEFWFRKKGMRCVALGGHNAVELLGATVHLRWRTTEAVV